MAGLTQAAYARRRGVTHRAVQKAILTGRITREPDGSIDPERADRDWERNSLPGQGRHRVVPGVAPVRPEPPVTRPPVPKPRAAVPKREAKAPAEPPPGRPEAPRPAVQPPPAPPAVNRTAEPPPSAGGFLASRAVREAYRARRERLAFERESGELVRVEEVKATAFAAGRRIREHLLSLADRIAPIVAGLTTRGDCHQVITEQVHRILMELDDKTAKKVS